VAECKRQGEGAFKTKETAAGKAHYHRLDGCTAAAPPPLPPRPLLGFPRAEADDLHAAYSALLEALSLSEGHRSALEARGLDGDAIARGQYRSLPAQGRSRIAGRLQERFGEKLARVPGFVVKDGQRGPYLTIAGKAGLLVPCRDLAGRIMALKVRADTVGKSGRYSYLSSTSHGGPGPGAQPHAPTGTPQQADVVRLTEGELKADVAWALSGVPTLSAPGATAWRKCLPMIKALGAKAVRLAFDADARTNSIVAGAARDCADGLAAEGLAVEVEQWSLEDGKGIDDLLAAGKKPEVLTGEEARRALEAWAEDAGAPAGGPGPSASARALEALGSRGPDAVFLDSSILRGLARLAEDDPAGYAAFRHAVKARLSLRDLDRALKPHKDAIRQERRAEASSSLPPLPYAEEGGRIVHLRMTEDGPASVPLANFTARITEEVERDDGSGEVTRLLAVEGSLDDGTPLHRVEVPAEEFSRMEWVIPRWGSRAAVQAGPGVRDHLRAALQMLSPSPARRVSHAALGWVRGDDGGWAYVHAAGAITAAGLDDAVEASLPQALTSYRLPDAPAVEAKGDAEGRARLQEAIRASLRVLDLGEPRLMVPLLAAVYRAPLGCVDFSLFLAGPTGCYKSEAAALAQQHYGAGMDARSLPASWSSTANANGELQFAARDALVVIDDFCPAGNASDVLRLNRDADRVFRGQGNGSGRQRMRADGTLRPDRPSRALVVATGEDTPRGQSLRARALILQVGRGDLGPAGCNPKLSACQRDAEEGLYALAMSGYLRWLAPRLGRLRDGLATEERDLRHSAHARATAHARTPGIAASLAVGWRHFLDYAQAAGAIDARKREDLWAMGWRSLLEAAGEQAEAAREEDPARRYLHLLASALVSGSAHLADARGQAPEEYTRWGWRGDFREASQPQGARIGWHAGGEVLLDPGAAYKVAQDQARARGESLPISEANLRRRLQEGGHLVTMEDQRGKLTVRRTLQGARRKVLHVRFPDGEEEIGPVGRPSGPVAEDEPAHENGTPDTPWHPLASAGNGVGQLGRLGRSLQQETAQEGGKESEWGGLDDE
jgi:hypothetical protein